MKPRKKYQRRKLFEASTYAPPERMVQIAEERTRDIIGAWASSLQWGKPIEPKILAQSCYMQGINDAIDAIQQQNLRVVEAGDNGTIYWP